MATAFLSANAALSAAVWWTTSGGSTTTTLGSGDDADLNSHQLTVDQTLTCANIKGAGTLTISGNRTINANVGDVGATSAFGVTAIGASQTVTVNGNVYGGITSTKFTVSNASAVLNINGTIIGGNASGIIGVTTSTGTVTVAAGSANVVGGSVANAYAIQCNGGVLSVTTTGDVAAGSAANGINTASGTVTIAASRILGSATAGIGMNVQGGTGTITLTSGIVGGAIASTFGMQFTGSPIYTVNSSITGGSGNSANGFGCLVNGGTLTIGAGGNYTVTGGSGTPNAIQNTNYGLVLQSGVLNLTANLVDTNVNALVHWGGTFNYTPTNSQTATIGGKTLYPTSGGGNLNLVSSGSGLVG